MPNQLLKMIAHFLNAESNNVEDIPFRNKYIVHKYLISQVERFAI